jgi:hypothetical protein
MVAPSAINSPRLCVELEFKEVQNKSPAVLPKLGLALKVLTPAIVCEPVVIKPLLLALALGILNVWVSTELAILKSVPVLPTAKY